MRLLPIALLPALLLPTIAGARLIAAPSYEEQLDRSDLVVIATPVASRDTDERIDLPGITTVMPDNRQTGFPVVGVETRFRVSVVFKGSRSLKEFVLHHYRSGQARLVGGTTGDYKRHAQASAKSATSDT